MKCITLKLFYDSEATSENILNTINNNKEEKSILFYFTGHGDETKIFLSDKPYSIYELKKTMYAVFPKSLFIIDACRIKDNETNIFFQLFDKLRYWTPSNEKQQTEFTRDKQILTTIFSIPQNEGGKAGDDDKFFDEFKEKVLENVDMTFYKLASTAKDKGMFGDKRAEIYDQNTERDSEINYSLYQKEDSLPVSLEINSYKFIESDNLGNTKILNAIISNDNIIIHLPPNVEINKLKPIIELSSNKINHMGDCKSLRKTCTLFYGTNYKIYKIKIHTISLNQEKDPRGSIYIEEKK